LATISTGPLKAGPRPTTSAGDSARLLEPAGTRGKSSAGWPPMRLAASVSTTVVAETKPSQPASALGGEAAGPLA
jgi:hypothetical protein